MKTVSIHTSPFIGRTREMKVLRSMLSDMEEHGTGSCAVIHGTPGTGKTRVLEEFESYARGRGITVLAVALSPSYRQKPFGAVYLILDAYFRLASKYNEKKKTELKKMLLSRCETIIPLLAGIHPGFAAFLQGKSSLKREHFHSDDRGRFHELLSVFLADMALFEEGLAIIVDDTQFCDRASIDVIDLNARLLGGMRCVIVTAYQESPGKSVSSDYPGLFMEDNDAIYDLNLEPFDRAAHQRFCAALFDVEESAAEPVSSFIFAATGGNPLFSREAALYLLNSGAVSVIDGAAAVDEEKTPSLDQFSSYVAASLKNAEQLSDSEKKILSVLAVLGMKFNDEWIHAFLPVYAADEISELPAALDNARALGFISSDEDSFRWTHGGVRDYFYQAAAPEFRRSLHRDIARFLEGKVGAEPELLFDTAYHFMKSGDDPDAVRWAFAAGEKALAVYAYDSAYDFFLFCAKDREGADRAAKETSHRGKISICSILLVKGRYAEAVQMLKDLLAVSQKDQHYEIFKLLSLAYFRLGDFSRCEDVCRRGLSLLGMTVPRFPRLSLCMQVFCAAAASVLPMSALAGEKRIQRTKAQIFFWETLVRVFAVSDRTLFLYSAFKVRTLVSRHFRNTAEQATSDLVAGASLMMTGRFRSALVYLENALACRQSDGDEWGVAQVRAHIGTLYLWTGNPSDAEDSLLESIRIFSSIGEVNERCSALFSLAELYISMARYDDAAKIALSGYDLALNVGDAYSCSLAASQLAVAFSGLGNDSCGERLESARTSAQQAGHKLCDFYAAYAEARIALKLGDFSRALSSVKTASLLSRFHRVPEYYRASLASLEAEAVSRGSLLEKGSFCRAALLVREAMIRSRRAEAFYSAGLIALDRGWGSAPFFFSKAASWAFVTGQRMVRAKALSSLGNIFKPHDRLRSLDYYEQAFTLFEDCGFSSGADAVLKNIAALDSTGERTDHITARRRLEFLLASQRISLSENRASIVSSMLSLAVSYCRASGGAIYLTEDDIVRIREVVTEGTVTEEMSRCARDVYISEEILRDESLSALCIPLLKGGDVAGTLCIEGEGVVSLAERDIEILSSGMMIASRALEAITEKLSSAERQERHVVPPTEEDGRIRRVVDYIRENFHDDISREGLASLVEMHPDNLGKMFKVHTGKKIGDFINDLRIGESMEKLSDTDMPIIDVAFSVGFESLRTFNRAFASIAGVTPSEYRMSARNRKELI